MPQAGQEWAGNVVQLARDLLPDIILLDIDMPGSGLEAARIIAEQCPVTRIVVLTSSEEDDHLIGALKIGARAYILKGVAARELIRILHAVWAGESYVPPILAASLLLEMRETHSQQKQLASPLDELTPREREILESLAAGLSNHKHPFCTRGWKRIRPARRDYFARRNKLVILFHTGLYRLMNSPTAARS